MRADRLTLQWLENETIAEVKLNRPEKVNAIDLEMFRALVGCIKKLKHNRRLRVVILSARGDHFSSGIDVKSMLHKKSSVLLLLKKWLPGNANLAQKVSSLWRDLPVPVVSVINGRCYGAGLQIVLGTDFRILNSNAKLSVMEAKWGLIPDMAGTLGFLESVNAMDAKFLAMCGEEFDAKAAKEMGLAWQVSESPEKDAFLLAKKLSANSPDAIAAVKKLLNRAYLANKRQVLGLETWYQVKVLFGRNRAEKVKMSLTNDNLGKQSFSPRSRLW